MSKTEQKKAGTLGMVASIVLCAILIPIIVLNTMMIVKTYTNPDHIPDVFGYSPIIVLSGSMEPVFGVESMVFIEDVDTNSLQQGDIITFLHGETAVTHRIAEIVTTDGAVSYVTKGDANNTVDRLPVSPYQIEGRYIGHVDDLGGVVMFMQSTTGMILFIALPIIIYLAYDLMLRQKETSAEKKRTEELEAELAALRAEKEKDPADIT